MASHSFLLCLTVLLALGLSNVNASIAVNHIVLSTDVALKDTTSFYTTGENLSANGVDYVKECGNSDASPYMVQYNQQGDTVDLALYITSGGVGGAFGIDAHGRGSAFIMEIAGEPGSSRKGFGCHANWLITFDLDTIRTKYFGGSTSAFTYTGRFGMVDSWNPDQRGQGVILVDGVVAGETDLVKVGDGGRDMSVYIDASARYLTVAMLNGDDSTNNDDQIWLDPTLTIAPTTSPTPSPTTSPTEAPTPSPSTSPTNAPTAVCDLRFGSDDIEKTWMSEYTISDGVVTVKVQEELEWIIENEEPTLTGQMVACISGFAWSYAEEGCDYREWTGAIGINALLQCSSGVAEDVSVVDGPDISRMRVEFEMSSLRNVEYYMAGVGDPTSIITTRNTLMPMLFDFQKTINVESQNIAVTSMYFPVTEVVATLTGSDDGEPLTDDEKDEITNSIAAHFNFPSAAIKFTFAESGSIVVTAQVPSDVSTTCAALTFTSFSAVVECAVGEDFASIREVTERSVISVGWTEGSISGLTAEANLKVYTNMQVPYELVNPQHKNQNSALTYSAFETTGTCSLNVDCEKYFKWTLTDDHASPVCTFSGSYEVEFDVVCSQEYNGYVCPLIGNETITTTVSLESGYHCPDTENAVDIALLATELFSNRVDSDDSETVTDSFLNTQTLKFHADVRADNAGLKDAKFIAISIADVNGGVDLELYNGGLTDSGTLLALAVTDIIDSTTDPESDSSVLSPSFTLIADADTLGLDLQETAVFQVTATIAAVYEADGVRRRALLQVSYDASTETSRTVIISAEDAAMQVLEESAAHNSVSAGLWLALLSVYTAFALHF